MKQPHSLCEHLVLLSLCNIKFWAREKYGRTIYIYTSYGNKGIVSRYYKHHLRNVSWYIFTLVMTLSGHIFCRKCVLLSLFNIFFNWHGIIFSGIELLIYIHLVSLERRIEIWIVVQINHVILSKVLEVLMIRLAHNLSCGKVMAIDCMLKILSIQKEASKGVIEQWIIKAHHYFG